MVYKGQRQKTTSSLLLEFHALCPPCFFLFLLPSYLAMIMSYAFELFYEFLVWLSAPPNSTSPAALGENCFLKAHTYRVSTDVCFLEPMGILCPFCFPQVLYLLSGSHKEPRSWSSSIFYSWLVECLHPESELWLTNVKLLHLPLVGRFKTWFIL